MTDTKVSMGQAYGSQPHLSVHKINFALVCTELFWRSFESGEQNNRNTVGQTYGKYGEKTHVNNDRFRVLIYQ